MLRIGFVNVGNATDPNFMSGAPAFVLRAFERAGCEVVRFFPLGEEPRVKTLAKVGGTVQKLVAATGRYYDYVREPGYCRALAQAVDARLAKTPVDVLFTQRNTCVSSLVTDVPVFTASDQPYPCLYEGYIERPTRHSVAIADRQSKDAIRVASRILVPSTWARERFAHYFPGSEAKVAVVPWGANLVDPPARETVDPLIEARAAEPTLTLAYVGKDWRRKDGATVVATAEQLARRGLKVRLVVVGARLETPPAGVEVENIAYLDRTTAEGEAAYARLLGAAHFVFVPSRFEAYGHVFCEGAAYGAPPVSRITGGVGEIIRDGLNGVALGPDATAGDFADRIEELARDRAAYGAMARAARDDFEQRLNWDAFARQVVAMMRASTR
jgi:glycosyltransferase involved in cell wall biosynthesis